MPYGARSQRQSEVAAPRNAAVISREEREGREDFEPPLASVSFRRVREP
jgi:hypothetical protein